MPITAEQMIATAFEMEGASTMALDEIVTPQGLESQDFKRGLFYGLFLAHSTLEGVDSMEDVMKALRIFEQVRDHAAKQIG